MLFINHQTSAQAAKDYYTQHIAPGDGRYYTEENAAQMKGVWHGRGAEMLQLAGEVKQDDFFRLCENVNPTTGERLTARTNSERRVMTDITFDVPKSVTLAYEIGGDARVPDSFRQSVRETMAEIEENVQTRVRKGGADADRPTGNLIWAEHIHRTTRPVDGLPDPQLHCHATVLNATYDSVENRWKAIQLGDIVRDKGYYQAAFHARLASKLKDLGYGIQKDGNSFKLAGIDRATVEKFSRRTAVIDKEAERLEIDDAASKSKLGRRTREKKSEQPQSMEELRTGWSMRLSEAERETLKTLNPHRIAADERIPEKAPGNAGDAPITPDQAQQFALDHSFQNSSAVSETRLKAVALNYAVGSVLPEGVADIAKHRDAIPVKHDGQLMITTKTVLDNEIAMLQFAKDGQRKFAPLVSDPEQLKAVLAGLSTEQRKAALHPLTGRDQVTGIRGGAGTGKTHTLQTVNAVISGIESRSGDYSRVFAFAPSSNASRGELRKVGFKDAETLASLFKNERMQATMHRQVILVDEAGLVSSKDMCRLFEIAKKQEARVILVGDYRQHPSVEAGDAFRLIEKEAGIRYAQLTEIRRQTTPEYKRAVEQISNGTSAGAQKGFDALDKIGNVIEASGGERHRLLVADYLEAQDEGKSALIIAPTHAEGQRLTDELRLALKERGVIGQEREFIARRPTGWTDAEKGDPRNYELGMVIDFHEAVAGKRRRLAGQRVTEGGFQKGEAAVVSAVAADSVAVMRQDGTITALPLAMRERFQVSRTREIAIGRGDRIRITKNGEARVEGHAKGVRINNGDVFTVEGFTKEGDIRLENGKLLPKDWGHFAQGYVDTSYASQGKTVDRVFIAAGNESLPAVGQQQWYVSTSRGKEMAKLYVDSKEDMRDAIARAGQRLSAVELTQTQLRPSWRERFHQSLERNRVGRFLKQRAAAIADYWKDRGRAKDVSYV